MADSQGQRFVRVRDVFALQAVIFASAGLIYLLIAIAARWHWEWGPFSFFWIYAPIAFFMERARYSGQKPPLRDDAVVLPRPHLLRDILFPGAVAAGAVLIGLASRSSLGNLVFCLLGAAALLGLGAHWLKLREAKTGTVLFLTTRFFSWWDSGIRESRAISWYPDPRLRHQWRFWDGTTWTASVADDGVVSEDPLEQTPSTPWT